MPYEEYKAFVEERCATFEAEAESIGDKKSKKYRYLRRLAYAYKTRLLKRTQNKNKEQETQGKG